MAAVPTIHIKPPPTTPHTHTIIFLHGRGSTAQTFSEELFESQDSTGQYFTDLFPSIKWVFPCAKKRWAEIDQEEMHQWFDMRSVQFPHEGSEAQRPALRESACELLQLVEVEGKSVGLCNVFLFERIDVKRRRCLTITRYAFRPTPFSSCLR